MRRISLALTAAVAVALVSGLSAQGKPSFAGTWTREAPAGGGGGGGGQRGRGMGMGMGFGAFNCGQTCTITQDAAKLVIERMQGETKTTTTFLLDGTESTNQVTMGFGGRRGGGGGAPAQPITLKSKATWTGDKLVVTTPMTMGETSFTSTQTISLEAGKLVIENTTDREGATPTKVTYTKG
jgi:hypothetical protein